MSELHRRFDLDDALKPARATIDASWSARKKKAIGAGAIALAAAALSAGAWYAYATQPPGLPQSAEEAMRVMGSSKFDLLDGARKGQYAAEAARLLGGLTDEQRRALFGNGENRDAMRAMREQLFEEAARRFARGEEMPFPRMGQRPQRPPEGEQQRPPFQQLTEAQRQEMMEQFRNRANERMDSQISSGNAQSGGLQSEMFKRRGGSGGGGRRGGGGGPRGG